MSIFYHCERVFFKIVIKKPALLSPEHFGMYLLYPHDRTTARYSKCTLSYLYIPTWFHPYQVVQEQEGRAEGRFALWPLVHILALLCVPNVSHSVVYLISDTYGRLREGSSMSRAGEGRMDELQQADNVKADSKFSKNSSRRQPSSFRQKGGVSIQAWKSPSSKGLICENSRR